MYTSPIMEAEELLTLIYFNHGDVRETGDD